MFLIRGIVCSYEAVRDWEAKLTPAMAEALRRLRRGKIGRSWYVGETYVKSKPVGAIFTAPSTHLAHWWTSR
jgi:transposase-like protein